MNTTAFITLILTLAITAPVIFIIANGHWLSYLRRRWVRLAVEPEVSGWQRAYFTDFIELLTRLNLPLGFTDEESIPQSGKIVLFNIFINNVSFTVKIPTISSTTNLEINELKKNCENTHNI
jgi:hypothetical protein